MSQLTIFTGKRQTGQTTRLVDCVINRASTTQVICFARTQAMTLELSKHIATKWQLTHGFELCETITVRNDFNQFLRNTELQLKELQETYSKFIIAIDDVPLDLLDKLTEISASLGIEVIASYSSDAKYMPSAW